MFVTDSVSIVCAFLPLTDVCAAWAYLPLTDETDTPDPTRRRLSNNSDSDGSEAPPDLPPRTPSRSLTNPPWMGGACATAGAGGGSINGGGTGGSSRSSRAVSLAGGADGGWVSLAQPPGGGGGGANLTQTWPTGRVIF